MESISLFLLIRFYYFTNDRNEQQERQMQQRFVVSCRGKANKTMKSSQAKQLIFTLENSKEKPRYIFIIIYNKYRFCFAYISANISCACVSIVYM